MDDEDRICRMLANARIKQKQTNYEYTHPNCNYVESSVNVHVYKE